MAGFTLSFRKQFATPILRGVKCQTIRQNRKDGKMPRHGDRVRIFIGMRTKQCKRLGIAEVVDSFPVYMDLTPGNLIMMARGIRLNFREMTEFAQADGFESTVAMLDWFRETYRGEKAFFGYCVKWKDLKTGPRRSS